MDKLEVDFACPNCGRKISQRAQDMRPGKSRTCPKCGTKIEFTGDDGRKAQKAIDDFQKSLKKLGNIKFKL